MGATNRLDIVDPALLRTGRYDRLVYIGEPSEGDRRRILSIHLRGMPVAGSAFERLTGIVRNIPEREFEDLLEALGSDRKVTADEIAGPLANRPVSEREVANPVKCRRLADLFASHRLTLDDPVLDALVASLAQMTEGYVGSDLEGVCREAGMLALREGSATVAERHFDDAVKKVRPTMNERSREYYRRMREVFKGGLPKEVQPPEYQ
jgi:transitional endoplasmic reticulum ATPase